MKEKKIDIDIYGAEIVLIYGTYDQIYNEFSETYPDLIHEIDQEFYCKYWVIGADNYITRYFLVNSTYKIGNIYHDSLHAANDILDIVGFKFSYDNDEPQAYLMEYIGDRVIKELKIMQDG